MALIKPKRPWMIYNKNKTFSKDVKLYNTQRWRKLSKLHLRAYPLCVECQEKGITTAAVVTDHIKPARLFPELFYEWDNLQSLCKSCHNTKSANERRKTKEYFTTNIKKIKNK